MIQFFAKDRHLANEFFNSWAPESREHVRTFNYGGFPLLQPFPGSVCVFTDLEILRPREMSLAVKLSDALGRQPENYSILNEPRGYTGRFNLLKTLYAAGVNQYQARRLEGFNGDLKFPIFVRNELNHNGPITPLLHSRDELERALAQPSLQNPALRKNLIVVEYCDCSKEGVFRKYSVMNVGGTLIPRHVLFSDDWATKTPDLVDEKKAAEEADFIQNFPHGEQILNVFRLAKLNYGRIDYGAREGRIQVWEINSNPVIVPPREEVNPLRMAAQAESARRIAEAIIELSSRHKSDGRHPFRSGSLVAAKASFHAWEMKMKLSRKFP